MIKSLIANMLKIRITHWNGLPVWRASKGGSLSANVALVVDNFILSVSLLTADIFNGIFPYVRNSAEWQKRSVWGVKYVNLLSWAAPVERPRHTPTRRIKEMLMLANLCAFLWFCWIETDVFPLMVSGSVQSIILCWWAFNLITLQLKIRFMP